jgi:membrane protein implicated in regulation of membrane protease activity
MSTLVNWTLILGGGVMILVEVSLGGFAGFDLVLIGSAFVLGGAVGLIFGSANLGVLSGGALCALYILAGRRFVRHRLEVKGVKSNTDAVIGAPGIVLARLAPHQPGRVKVRDEEWRAMLAPGVAGPIEAGAEITVAGVDGVTLQVR